MLATGTSLAARLVFFGSFAFFLIVRAWNPEIYWGEKPMDFAFLNALWRAPSVPPPEPWMSGTPINYSYLGHFGVAALAKLVRVEPALAFNLGVATVGALTSAAAFGAGAALSGRVTVGVLAALLVAFAGNLSGPLELASRGKIDFHYFWATSRVIADTINEFPLWSFVFADLHAHMMALPLSALLLGVVCVWFRERRTFPVALVGLASLSLGAIAATSTWSVPVYVALLVGIGALSALCNRSVWRLAFPVVTIALSYVWFLPYWRRYVAPPANWGLETQAAPLCGVLLIFGLFLSIVGFALWDLARRERLRRIPALLMLAVLAVAAAHSVRAAASLMAGLCLAACFRERDLASRLAFLLAAGGIAILAAADTFYLWDRMNTIFKLYLEGWVLLALASAYLAPRLAGGTGAWRWLRAGGIGLLAAVSALTAVTDVIGALRTQRVPGPRPTLDGQAYLFRHRPGDASAFRWMNETLSGSPIVLEAHGPSYGEFGRVSMNTGLPTVAGWDYHLFQRSHSWAAIDARKEAVRQMYSSSRRPLVEHLLREYRVSIVYVGPLERSTYPPAGLSKLAVWDDLFQPIYRNDTVTIYAVVPNFDWSEREATDTLPSPAVTPSAQRPPSALGILREPRGVALDSRGNVWVADFGNDRIHQFDSELEPLRAIGGHGDGPGEFDDPCGIAIGPNGRIYVADTWNHRVQVFDEEGRFLDQWRAELYGPRGIAVGPDGAVYVADTGNGRIVQFDPEGAEISRWGRKGKERGEFEEPTGIEVGPDGRVYVADAGNRRIVVLSPLGHVLESWSVPGWTEQTYREPDLALLPDGGVAATDPTGDRLFFFDSAGSLVEQRLFARGSGPAGIALAADGRLLVAELRRNRIGWISERAQPRATEPGKAPSDRRSRTRSRAIRKASG